MKRIILLIALIGIGVGSFAQNSTLAKGKKVNIPMSEAAMIPGASATSGTLTVGLTYVIGVFETGDDFANVGAGSNATGVEFIATGTTPTDWSNGSLLSALNQSTKDLADNSTITANNVYPTQGVRGNGQKWFKFDGTDDYVNIADAAGVQFPTSDFTLMCKFKATDVSGDFYLINKGANATNGGWNLLFDQSEGRIEFVAEEDGTGANKINYLSNFLPVANTEYVLFLVVDRSDKTYLYIDGVVQTYNTNIMVVDGSIIDRNKDFVVGADWSLSSGFLDGTISDVHTYNYAVPADSITSWSTKIDEGTFHLPAVDQGATNTVLTSGTLELGKIYLIIDWITNDDFTNVGGANVDGTVFTCAGSITPTVWTNSSTVVELGSTLSLSPEGIYSTAWNDYYHLTSYAVDGPTRQEYGKHTALRFNGSDSKLTRASSYEINTNSSIITFWAKRDATGTAHTIAGLAGSNTNSYIQFSASGTITMETDTNADVATGTLDTDDTSWHSYVIVFDNLAVTMYQDGVAITMADGTVTDGELTIDQLGVLGASTSYYNGEMQGFNVYDKGLVPMPIAEFALLFHESTK